MIDQNTEAGVPFSFARATAPGSEGEGAARSQFEGGRVPRTAEDDLRVVYHEASHAALGRLLTGVALGGCTCEPGEGYSGLAWGPQYVRRSKFSSNDIPDFCAQIASVMPSRGESRESAADAYLHAHNRVTELVAGTEGERLFLPGEPWFAADDERQAIAYAGLICSAEAIEAFIDYCRKEARVLLTTWAHVVRALADQLRRERTMDGAAIDLCIARAVAAKALTDERARRASWKRVEQSAASFVRDAVG